MILEVEYYRHAKDPVLYSEKDFGLTELKRQLKEAEAAGVGVATFFSVLARHGWKETEREENKREYWYDRDVGLLFRYDEKRGGYCRTSRIQTKRRGLKSSPVDTPFGAFDDRRDGLIIKALRADGDLTFSLNMISDGVTKPPKGAGVDFEFTLTFKNVVSYFTAEYDTYMGTVKREWSSCFEEVLNSPYRKKLKIRGDFPPVKHYRLMTYDDVFDILAAGFEITLADGKEK